MTLCNPCILLHYHVTTSMSYSVALPIAFNVSTTLFCQCPQGKYGSACSLNCTCGPFSKGCDALTGKCICLPGYSGGKVLYKMEIVLPCFN